MFTFEKVNFAPVDGHNPMCKDQKVYPDLGRKLGAQDIGKYVMRTFPHNCDWSYIPRKKNNINDCKLVSLDNNKITIMLSYLFLNTNTLNEGWNDTNWCTKKEWKKYQKSLEAKPKEPSQFDTTEDGLYDSVPIQRQIDGCIIGKGLF